MPRKLPQKTAGKLKKEKDENLANKILEPQVVYEDENLLFINKPSGLIVHPTKYNEPSLIDWLIKKYPEIKTVGDKPEIRPGIVHRLDKDASGLMVIAKNQKSFEYLKNLFKNHQVQKKYLAWVLGEVNQNGIIDKPIGIKSKTIRRSVHSPKFSKSAITKYKVLKIIKINNQKFSLLEVSPQTGRTHQIRIHLNSINHPIVGDKLYGPKNPAQKLYLFAKSLEFNFCDNKRIKVELLPSDDFKNFPNQVF